MRTSFISNGGRFARRERKLGIETRSRNGCSGRAAWEKVGREKADGENVANGENVAGGMELKRHVAS